MVWPSGRRAAAAGRRLCERYRGRQTDGAIEQCKYIHDRPVRRASARVGERFLWVSFQPHQGEGHSWLAAALRLRKILTNPNFVSVDEVEIRDDEIVRLRQGWEHMEKRWVDVLTMMDGWRRRMDTGETLRLEDLQQGMGLVSPMRDERAVRGDDYEDPDQSFVEGDISEIQLPEDDEDIDESSMLMDAPQLSGSLALLSASKRKRDVLEPPATFDLRPPGTVQRSSTKANKAAASPSRHDDGEAQALEQHEFSEQPSEVQMTLNEKLDAVAREAADAQTREKKDGPPALDGAADEDELRDDDTLGQIFSPVRKTKIRGRAKRRKSTLSREELAELLVAGEE